MIQNWYKVAFDRFSAIPYIDMSKIPAEAKGGDCYEVSGKYILANGYHNTDLRLAHGNVMGQGKISGVQYDHAWIEDGDMIIDKSLGRDLKFPKVVYYAIGRIEDVKLYTMEEVRKLVLEHEHWGPWE